MKQNKPVICPKCKRAHPPRVDNHEGGLCQWCRNGIPTSNKPKPKK